jgi:hypothetical protein
VIQIDLRGDRLGQDPDELDLVMEPVSVLVKRQSPGLARPDAVSQPVNHVLHRLDVSGDPHLDRHPLAGVLRAADLALLPRP